MRLSICNKIRDHWHETVLCVLGCLYFLLLLRFYLIEYYVPDFRAYSIWAKTGVLAHGGYSSLFIWFSAFLASMPKFMTVFSLLLLTLSIVNTAFFIKSLFKEINLFYYICISLLYSCSVFYYFYGKIFYDFPFTAFSYSVSLLILKRLYEALENGTQPARNWFLFCGSLGLLLSWKTYNIFCVAGIVLLMLTKRNGFVFLRGGVS